MKGIRFLPENNLQFRSVTEAEEATLIRYCSPYLQDLAVFATNTGFRLGEILKLKWEEVDLDHGTVRTLVRKTQQMIDLPLNDEAARVVRGWHGIRRGGVCFLQPGDGWSVERPVAWSQEGLPKGGIR